MSLVNRDLSIVNNAMNSQQISADVEKWLQSGNQVQQLASDQNTNRFHNFNNGFKQDICDLQSSAWQYSTVTERRKIILKYIAMHPKSSCGVISAHLKIWQGNVSKDIQVLRKNNLIFHERIGLFYYYSVAVASSGANHD